MNSFGQINNSKVIDFYKKSFLVIGIIFITVLSLKSIFVFYLLIFIFPFILLKHQIKIDTLIICLVLFFGLFHFFYQNEIIGENYKSYILLIENDLIPKLNYNQNTMPGYHIFAYFLKNNLFLIPEIIQKFMRIFLFLLMALGIKNIAEYIAKEYKINKNFVIYTVLVFVIDWNINYLLLGDQFRNSFAQVFYIFFLLSLFKREKFKYILFGIASILFHKMFIVVIPLTFLLFIGIGLLKKIKKDWLFALSPLVIFIFVKFTQFFTKYYFNIFSFADKFQHPVPAGLGAFTFGVWLAVIFYGLIICLSYRYYSYLIERDILFFSFIFFLFGFIISKVNILGINFVEPNRVYILFAPLFSILFGFFLIKIRESKLIISLYLLYNITLINFAKQAYTPSLELMKYSVFDIPKIYFNDNLQQVGLVILYILVFLFIFVVIKKNRFIFSLFNILNVMIFFFFYKFTNNIFPVSIFFFLFFSIWPLTDNRYNISYNVGLNMAIFSLWEFVYILMNLKAFQMNIHNIMIESLLIWSLIVLFLNIFYAVDYLKIQVTKI